MVRIVFTPMSAEAWALNSKAKTLNGAITVSDLTAGRVVFAGTGGLLSDDADFTFSVDTLTVTKIAATEFTGVITVNLSTVGFILGTTVNGLYFRPNEINSGYYENGLDTLYVNYRGYNDANTQFRNLIISDGKYGQIAAFTGSTLAAVFAGAVEVDGDLNHDGSNIGFYGIAPVARSAGWTITNDGADRAFDADTVAVAELADVVATLITDLAATGIIGASA